MNRTLHIPELSLVVLIGASGSGKSTFARRRFKSSEVLSSDFFRGLVSDDENDQSASKDAFDTLHVVAEKRLARGLLTVIDATNVKPEARQPYLELARQYHVLPVTIVFNLSERVCQERNRQRPDRRLGPYVIAQQHLQMRHSIRNLQQEGFRAVFVFEAPEEVDAAVVERVPMWTDRRTERGPFDVVGDIHGCYDELVALLLRLGYALEPPRDGALRYGMRHPEGRQLIFLGDLVDRGPRVPDVLRLVMDAVEYGGALCVPGNHDVRYLRTLRGKTVRMTHGLDRTLDQMENEPNLRERTLEFLGSLISHYVLDEGRLVVAHAGLKESMQGRGSGRVRDFALYGETTGETDEFGLPIRYPWARDYRGRAIVVYGHTPVYEPEWLNRTINIDTGCVFGGRLSALRYPEKEIVSVRAAYTYCEPSKPFLPEARQAPSLTAQQTYDDVLDLEDVRGTRVVLTRLHRHVTIREEYMAAALEAMSRWGANPKWIPYLPPTMAPSETSREPGLLEHPAEAFLYYRRHGVPRVICEEKHMGSRAVVVIARDEDAVRRRFGVLGEGIGIAYTRTGRRFFTDEALERQLLARLHAALTSAGFWEQFKSDWFCLDAELMPWSIKARELVRRQYAATAAAGRAAFQETIAALEQTAGRTRDAQALLERFRDRAQLVDRFADIYHHYCWPVASITDLKLAPFHLLATERAVHADKDHGWHLDTLAQLSHADREIMRATPYRVIDVTDPDSQRKAMEWWEELTARGGEGMVVKPLPFVIKGRRGLVQPALKCRGREYLRIIYGPEYTAPEHLDRLRQRGLSLKRTLALREFALGIEGLERFARYEPLRRTHECVLAVLALESQPVDPRL